MEEMSIPKHLLSLKPKFNKEKSVKLHTCLILAADKGYKQHSFTCTSSIECLIFFIILSLFLTFK